MFFDFLNDIGNYEQRKIGCIRSEDNGGIGVSTAYTSDEGYETALGDANGIHPVERYDTREDAVNGHEKWVKFAKTGQGKKIKRLGWTGLGMDKEITLVAV